MKAESQAPDVNLRELGEPGGGLLGAAAIIRNVTARWERELALRKRVATLEAAKREG